MSDIKRDQSEAHGAHTVKMPGCPAGASEKVLKMGLTGANRVTKVPASFSISRRP